MHNIRYTQLAKDDLFNIFEIIASDKPSVAVDYISKLEEYIELLESNSKMGVECKKKNINQNCRVLIYQNYLIFYRIQKDEIHILRVLNSKRDYKTML